MSSRSYRIYIRYGEFNCLRFFAPGSGTVAKDGLQLFNWIRNPGNITRLRNGIQYVYEIDRKELQHFLEFKLRQNRLSMGEQINKDSGRGDMLAALSRKRVEFSSLKAGVDMLDVVSNATESTVIPRTPPRKTSDKPGWLYLLNLDQETLEVYEFEDYNPYKVSSSSRLAIKSLYRGDPKSPPGYYIKLKLSELQLMSPTEWITLHEIHAKTLSWLWRRNARVFKTIPHADTIPFSVLYGSVSYGQHGDRMNLCRPNRVTRARLTEVLGALNRRLLSKVPIFESEPSQSRSVVDNRLDKLQARMLRLQEERILDRRRRQAHRG
ncbi:hypothetical protein F4859DRAFT_303840 [Xylaria cf. heliscus]|nr:hypothetical protein F4859DRAFT_303840 [Xylaria cf. heliscus]